MEVGIFPAYPRAVAAWGLCVSLKLLIRIEELVSLVISAAKILIPETVVRRETMYPQAVMSFWPRVSREHWRGDNGRKNGHYAKCFYHCHWLSPPGDAARMNNHIHRHSNGSCFPTLIFGVSEPVSEGVRHPRALGLGE